MLTQLERVATALVPSAVLSVAAMPTALAVACRHGSASNNIECTGRVPAPWIHDGSNRCGGIGAHPSNSLAEAAAKAIAEIAGYFTSF